MEEQGKQILSEARAETEAAIASLNSTIATTSIEMALAIAPQDPGLQKLAARVETLDELSQLIEAGDQALAEG